LKLEYQGTNFVGWQWQATGRTVQGEIKRNLEKFLRHDIKLTGSGRTDSGVHAISQYANFMTTNPIKIDDIKHKLNRMLPRDLIVLACREVSASFDARRDATYRKYRYLICERPSAIHWGFSWVLGRKLDLALLRELSEYVARARYFDNFCKAKSRKEVNECHIYYARWGRSGGFLRFDITANRFLHNMVRLLVGTMVAVCDGMMSAEHFKNLLDNKQNEKTKYLAPAAGLYLVDVGYERGNR
jgi:tRNA pseudouridine38-40 synthase